MTTPKASKWITCALCSIVLLLPGCSTGPAASLAGSLDVKPIIAALPAEAPDAPEGHIERYDVYGHGATRKGPDDFSIAMHENPIDRRMYEELYTTDINGTTEMLVFYSGYLQLWQAELDFSLDNLRALLTEEEAGLLEQAQGEWYESWEANTGFDGQVIASRSLLLGTQYHPSRTIYSISQYRERVFHIKYLTYLLEGEGLQGSAPWPGQTWDLFHVAYDG